jgi:hypothetical protein
MLRLLAEVDEFILEQSMFFCENSIDYMVYSYKWNDNCIVKIIIKSMDNGNLCANVKINDDVRNIKEEFRNIDQFKYFFCRYFNKYLL